MAKLKVAWGAGHGLYTAGKRCLKSLDPNETREWVLNDRIVRYGIDELLKYEDVEILRTDDPTGKRDIPLPERAKKANEWSADIYLSEHHNAGINGGEGGGLVVYIHNSLKNNSLTAQYQKKIYDEQIKLTGLKGNRASPLSKANFVILRLTKMPAILIENGFMDSQVDVPIILSDNFARKAAQARVNFLVKEFNLKKKVTPSNTDIYRVRVDGTQIGAYRDPNNILRNVEKNIGKADLIEIEKV